MSSALRGWAGEMIVQLQERLGPEFVDEQLRDLVGGQAGAMLSFLAGALTRMVGGGFALFNVLSLLVVTPVVAFYLLRDWPRVVRARRWLAAAALCRRAAGAGARGGPHPLRLAARAGAVLPGAGAVLRGRALAGGARSRADRRALGGRAVVHPLCRHDHRRRSPRSGWRSRSSRTGRAWSWWWACSSSASSWRAT